MPTGPPLPGLAGRHNTAKCFEKDDLRTHAGLYHRFFGPDLSQAMQLEQFMKFLKELHQVGCSCARWAAQAGRAAGCPGCLAGCCCLRSAAAGSLRMAGSAIARGWRGTLPGCGAFFAGGEGLVCVCGGGGSWGCWGYG
jgi:hypothetical protein